MIRSTGYRSSCPVVVVVVVNARISGGLGKLCVVQVPQVCGTVVVMRYHPR